MEKLTVGQVVDGIDGSVCPGGEASRVVDVCGANCPGREAVALALRAAGISVAQRGCHGPRGGGCAQNGTLAAHETAAYATVPQRTDHGVEYVETIVTVNVSPYVGDIELPARLRT